MYIQIMTWKGFRKTVCRRNVGNTGFEPVTSSMSRKRANQLRQLPV
jgi:hypothetical protein